MQTLIENAAIILAVAAMLGQMIAWISRAGRRRIDEASILSDGALELYREVKSENSNLEKRLIALRKENSQLRGRVRSLEENERMRERHTLELEQSIAEMRNEMKRIRAENKRLSGRMSDHESRTDWQVPKD